MAAPLPRRKVLLLVEDDNLTREAFTIILEGEGYTVRSAGDGQEALEELQGEPRPDCILLDLRMPRMDGRQFRARQKQDPALAPVPVVLVSGDRNVAREASKLGAAGYVQKPVDPSTLLAAVREHCPEEPPANQAGAQPS